MPVQFPNFLGAQLVKPDYSGLGDIFQNYYAGKDMPREAEIRKYQAQGAPLDYLMKQVQSEFARPNAEQTLQGLKLGNRSSQLTNRKSEMSIKALQQELNNQASFEAAEKAARQASPSNGSGNGMGGGQGGGMGMGGRDTRSMAPVLSQALNNLPNAPHDVPGAAMSEPAVRQQLNGTAFQKALQDVMGLPQMKNMQMPTQMPIMNDHPAEQEVQSEQAQAMASQSPTSNQPKSQVQEIESGNPSSYWVDKFWDDNPKMHAYIKKRGYKEKDVKPEFDKRTGETRIRTTWPSGRITIKTITPPKKEGELDTPLTTTMKSKHQNVVASVDTALPTLRKIEQMKVMPLWTTPGGHTKEAAQYDKYVNRVLDSMLGAYGVPLSDKGLQSVKDQIKIKWYESTEDYKERLKETIEDLIDRQKYSKKLLSSSPRDTYNDSDERQSYSSNEWEVADEK